MTDETDLTQWHTYYSFWPRRTLHEGYKSGKLWRRKTKDGFEYLRNTEEFRRMVEISARRQ